MSTSRRSRIIFPLVSIVTAFALSAQAQEPPKGPPPKGGPGRPGVQAGHPGPGHPGPRPMKGPPAYVSDVEFMDYAGGPDGPPVEAGGYPPPAVAYAPAYAPPPPPPPPPPPDAAAGAVGGAVVGGLLGGLISGRPGGAIAGAVAGGTVGAIAGAQAANRPGYYLAQGNCYYRYPSGKTVQVDPRTCY